jgi:hypothetical protein
LWGLEPPTNVLYKTSKKSLYTFKACTYEIHLEVHQKVIGCELRVFRRLSRERTLFELGECRRKKTSENTKQIHR